jgi:hypothetical protein
MLFLPIQPYHLDEATKSQGRTVSVTSDQSLSSRLTNEEGKGPEQIYLRNMFSLQVGIGRRGVLLSDPAMDWRLYCEGSYPRLNYYHANVHALPDHPTGLGVRCDLFVSALFAVGLILVVYGHHYP